MKNKIQQYINAIKKAFITPLAVSIKKDRNEIIYLNKVENSNFISDFGGLNYSDKKGIFEEYKQYNLVNKNDFRKTTSRKIKSKK